MRTTNWVIAAALCGCGGDDGRADGDPTGPGPTSSGANTASAGDTDPADSLMPTTGEPGTATTAGTATGATGSTGDTPTTTAGSSTAGLECTDCDDANQTCQDGQCITTCQGQDPSPCGADEVCDV